MLLWSIFTATTTFAALALENLPRNKIKSIKSM